MPRIKGRVLILPLLFILVTTCSASRLNSVTPAAKVAFQLDRTVVRSTLPAVPIVLPRLGSFAMDSDDGLISVRQSADLVRPTGSLAKAMTALAVLNAHPLAGDQQGPVLTMTQQDVDEFVRTIEEDGSYFPVSKGERLTERDLLYALMLPSANNIAETLGRWVSGSHTAFVALLNHTAASTGLSHTHFDDASGFSPRTVSTAADLLKIAQAVIRDPVLSRIVLAPQHRLTTGATVYNLDWLLHTQPGWLGIKTGQTDQAGACYMFAVRRLPAGSHQAVTLVGIVLGQPVGLGAAFGAAVDAVNSAYAGYQDVLLSAPSLLGGITTRWGSRSGVVAVHVETLELLVRRGQPIDYLVHVGRVRALPAAQTPVGSVEATIAGTRVGRWSVVTRSPITAPDWWWRLVNG